MGFYEGYVWYGGCGIICGVCVPMCGGRGGEEMWCSVVHDVCIYVFVYLCVCMVCVHCMENMICVYVCA